MGTLIVKVTAKCEGLLHSLPRGGGWELVSEDYNEDGSGTVTIDFDGDDLSAAAEQALNTNDDVKKFSVVETPDRRLNNQGFPIDMAEELLSRYGDDDE